jgi:plasmid stability protein
MASMTIRDIPDDVVERLKILSQRERRSLNKEFVVMVERGLRTSMTALGRGGPEPHLSASGQAELWAALAGRWEDERPTAEIIADIRNSRTLGREVAL